jgi:putative ABC transport system substrate-binding protein
VFVIGADPVELGLISSLNRPGANVTGLYILVQLLTAKRLELLRELVPAATSIGLLTNPIGPIAGAERSQAETRRGFLESDW